MKNLIIIFTFLISSVSVAKIGRSPASIGEKTLLLENLVNNNLIYSAQEIIRSDLQNNKWANNYERYLDVIISEIGTEQLDRIDLSSRQLRESKNLNYISGKNLLRRGKAKEAASKLKNSLSQEKEFYPNQLFLYATALLLEGKKNEAMNNFVECENILRTNMERDDSLFAQEKQIIKDTCILNQARLDFENGNFLQANQQYEKIRKSSLVWPEILFEEAWSSFYLGNFNRTLGKLVTYKSPFFDFIFNPEVEVLEALSYMELCFYQNTQDVVNNFYNNYGNDAQYLKKFLSRYSSQQSKVGSLLINFKNRAAIKNKLLSRLLNSISKDLVFKRLMKNYQGIKDEINLVKNYPDKRYISYLAKNLKLAEQRQKKLIGIYGLRILDRANRVLDKSFRGMSYIKLEILKKEKDKFFGKDYKTGKIGDLKNVEFDSRHYLWEFNGEFWADELGDYVFSLKSECKI